MIIDVYCDELEAAVLQGYAKKKGITVSDFVLAAALDKIFNECKHVGRVEKQTSDQILQDILDGNNTKERSKFRKIVEILYGK